MFTIVGAQGFDFVTVATRSDMARIRIWNGPEIWRIGRCRLDGTRLAVSVGHVFAKARTVLVPYMTDSGGTMLRLISASGMVGRKSKARAYCLIKVRTGGALDKAGKWT